jgi:hypothetical protein
MEHVLELSVPEEAIVAGSADLLRQKVGLPLRAHAGSSWSVNAAPVVTGRAPQLITLLPL